MCSLIHLGSPVLEAEILGQTWDCLKAADLGGAKIQVWGLWGLWLPKQQDQAEMLGGHLAGSLY